MRRNTNHFFFALILIFSLFFLSGCNTTTELDLDELSIEAIDAFDIPSGVYTVDYTIDQVNEYIAEYGLEVVITAIDQYGLSIDVTQNTFYVLAGRIYTVTITALIDGEIIREKTITVIAVEKTIVSIAITTNPAKMHYYETEFFDPTGMVVTATYSDSSTLVLYDFTYSSSSLGLDDTNLLITHPSSGLSTSVSLTIHPLSEAVWTVTFDGAGGQLVSGNESQSILHGEGAIAPTYTKKDCLFNGFDVTFDQVTSHLVVTAQWIDTTLGTTGLDFALNGSTSYSVVGYWGDSSLVIVPPTHNGLPVTRIGNNAFLNNTVIQEIRLPASINSFGITPFSGALHLDSILVALDNPYFQSLDGILYDVTGSTLLLCPQGKTDELTIPEGVIALGANSLYSCRGLTDIHFPSTLSAIGSQALDNTQWLDNQQDGLVYAGNVAYRYIGDMPENTRIELVEGTLGIAAEAFALQEHLIDITIPSSVVSIGNQAFLGSVGLSDLILPNSVVSIGSGAFEDCTNLVNLHVSDQITHLGANAFANTTWFDSQPDGVVYIGSIVYLYKGEIPLNTVLELLPSTIAIADYAFYQSDANDHLVSINLPASLVFIGESAFSGNLGLTMVLIPESVTTIGNFAFYNTIVDLYAEALSQPLGWEAYWNVNERPVIWNCMNASYAFDYQFDSMGGSPIDTLHTVFLASLPTPLKTGFTFLGWYETANYTGEAVRAPYYSESKADTTLYAKWEVSVYQVTFLIDGWDTIGGGNSVQFVQHGDSITTPPVIEKAGYLFLAWLTPLDNITESINVVPVWAKLTVDTTQLSTEGVWVQVEYAFPGITVEIDFGTGSYVTYVRGSQTLIITNTTIQARASYQGGNWIDFTAIVIDNIDRTRPTKPTYETIRTENGTLALTIIGGMDTGSGVLRHEYQIGSSDEWIPFTSAHLELNVPNHTLIRARTVDLAGNVSLTNERYLRIDLVSMTSTDEELVQRYVVTEIISPNGAITTTNISLRGAFWEDQSTYQTFVSYSYGDRYPGCGVKAGQIMLNWFGAEYPLFVINQLVETTDFGKYIEWATEDTWADPSVFTTPAQMVSGLQGLIDETFEGYEVIRRSPESTAEAIAMIESSLADGFPVVLLVNDGAHWQVISESSVQRNEAGEIVSASFLTHDDAGAQYRSWSNIDFFFEDNWDAELARAFDYTSYVDTIISIRYEVPLQTENWSSGWSSAEFFSTGDQSYVFLSKNDGTIHINQVNPDGTIGALVHSYAWSSGWDNVSFYTENGVTYLVLFKSSNQLLHIRQMNVDGSVGTLTTETNLPNSALPDVTILNAVTIDGIVYLEAASTKGTGDIAVNWLFDLNDFGVLGDEISHDLRYNHAFTNSTIFEAYGKAYVIVTDASSGLVAIYAITDTLEFGELVAEYDWSDGWSNVIPYTVLGETYLLISKSGVLQADGILADGDGLTRILQVNEDGTLGVQIDSTYWKTNGNFMMYFGYNVIRFYQNALGETCLFALRGSDGAMKILTIETDGTIHTLLS